mmetsp:Transcript_4386/g.4441  ORF Transcript_4386/g.4441 Transcript_4386/m.4441 type:complete len:82 (-) Transcript_4386:67-312(-)
MQNDRTILMPTRLNSQGYIQQFFGAALDPYSFCTAFFVQAFSISTIYYGHWKRPGSIGRNNQVTVKVAVQKCSPPLILISF